MTEILGAVVLWALVALLLMALLADMLVGLFPLGWRRRRRVGLNTKDAAPHFTTESMEIRCPACGAVNRVPESRVREPGRCGKCKTPLATVVALPYARRVMRLLPQLRTALIVLLVTFA